MTDTIKDEVLVEKARSGDHDAFRLLYERYRNGIFRFLYRFLGSAEIAEDITHDCFMSMVRESETSQSTRLPFRTRLYSNARALGIKYVRNSAQGPALKNRSQDHRPRSAELPNNDAQLVSSGLEMAEAVAALPPSEREALVLFEYERLELAEVAAIVGSDVEKVAARLRSARQRLSNVLAKPPIK